MIDEVDEAYADGLDAVVFVNDLNERAKRGRLREVDVLVYQNNLSNARKRAADVLKKSDYISDADVIRLNRVISMIDEALVVVRNKLEQIKKE